MKQTDARGFDGWVYIVLHSGALTYQIFDDARVPRRTRGSRLVRLIARMFVVGKQIYSLTV